jgi:hypothetical protein
MQATISKSARNKIQASRDKIQASRNKIQIGRNKIQMIVRRRLRLFKGLA